MAASVRSSHETSCCPYSSANPLLTLSGTLTARAAILESVPPSRDRPVGSSSADTPSSCPFQYSRSSRNVNARHAIPTAGSTLRQNAPCTWTKAVWEIERRYAVELSFPVLKILAERQRTPRNSNGRLHPAAERPLHVDQSGMGLVEDSVPATTSAIGQSPARLARIRTLSFY